MYNLVAQIPCLKMDIFKLQKLQNELRVNRYKGQQMDKTI